MTTNEKSSETVTENQEFKGRSVFLVETTPAGIAVQTGLLTDDGKVLQMPAIFPDVQYAFDQIDELKRLVSQHFSQAAQIGAQAMAHQPKDSSVN